MVIQCHQQAQGLPCSGASDWANADASIADERLRRGPGPVAMSKPGGEMLPRTDLKNAAKDSIPD